MRFSSSLRAKVALPLLVLFVSSIVLFGNAVTVVHAAAPTKHAIRVKRVLKHTSSKHVLRHTSSDSSYSFDISPTEWISIQFYYPTCDASCGNETWYASNIPPNSSSWFDPPVTTGSNITTWTLQTTWATVPIGSSYLITIGATSDAGITLGALDIVANVVGPLLIPFLSQYQGQTTQNFDCGPASVAMILEYFNVAPNSSSPGELITQVRNATGNPGSSDTSFSQLETAISYYGLTYSEIPNTLTPQPDAQIQAIAQSVTNGQPVIALVHGADLGRGANYGDHWLIVTGFSSDGQTVYLNDPDDQTPKLTGWIQGGQMSLPMSTFRQALYDAAHGPYAIVVNIPFV